MTTMKAVNSANIARTSSQLQIVLAWKVEGDPVHEAFDAAVIPFDSSHGKNAARKKSEEQAADERAHDGRGGSHVELAESRSPPRYSSRVIGLVPDRIGPGYAIPGRSLRAGDQQASGGSAGRCSVPVVVTDGLEHEAHRIEPEGRVIGRWVLGEGARRLQHLAADVEDPQLRRTSDRVRDHERQMLQAGPVLLVADGGDGGIEEEVGLWLAAAGRYANWSCSARSGSKPRNGTARRLVAASALPRSGTLMPRCRA